MMAAHGRNSNLLHVLSTVLAVHLKIGNFTDSIKLLSCVDSAVTNSKGLVMRLRHPFAAHYLPICLYRTNSKR